MIDLDQKREALEARNQKWRNSASPWVRKVTGIYLFTHTPHIVVLWLSNVSVLLLGWCVPSLMLGRGWNQLLEMGLECTFLHRLLQPILPVITLSAFTSYFPGPFFHLSRARVEPEIPSLLFMANIGWILFLLLRTLLLCSTCIFYFFLKIRV